MGFGGGWQRSSRQPGFAPIFPTLLAVNKSGEQNTVCLKPHLKFVEQKRQRRSAVTQGTASGAFSL